MAKKALGSFQYLYESRITSGERYYEVTHGARGRVIIREKPDRYEKSVGAKSGGTTIIQVMRTILDGKGSMAAVASIEDHATFSEYGIQINASLDSMPCQQYDVPLPMTHQPFGVGIQVTPAMSVAEFRSWGVVAKLAFSNSFDANASSGRMLCVQISTPLAFLIANPPTAFLTSYDFIAPQIEWPMDVDMPGALIGEAGDFQGMIELRC